MRIYILCEDTENKPYLSEHGFSALVEFEGSKILFDTGMTDVFIKNAERMGLDLNDVDDVVISHGHYDHIGGLERFFKYRKAGKKLRVWVGEGIFVEKYSDERFAGVRLDTKRYDDVEFIHVGESVEIKKNVFVWGPAPMINDFERIPSHFRIFDGFVKIQDEFKDERNLTIRTDKGLIILTGCAHRGIVNIVDYASKKYGEKILMVIGGFHLISSSDERIMKTVNLFNEKYHIEKLAPCHCTGRRAIEIFRREFKGELIGCYPGKVVEI
ncbi:MAG TPA: MBL fold metallo-hydrolase [Thermotogales bacterium]|nr:MBL fold metallo-hydrolase [Thermotogales bacterium]